MNRWTTGALRATRMGLLSLGLVFCLDARDSLRAGQAPKPPAAPKPAAPAEADPTDAPSPKISLVPGKMPVFDLDYFIGRWDGTWILPDSVLGPAGEYSASETIKPSADPKFYISEVKGTGPSGDYKGRAIMTHAPMTWVLSRYESDSTGVDSLKEGRIGAEEGHYIINWAGTPFVKNGHTIAVRSKLILMSPSAFRQMTQISVDGGPFIYLGSAWFYKDMNEPPLRRRPAR